MKNIVNVVVLAWLCVCCVRLVSAQEITRIWLTYKRSVPSHLVVNWMTDQPGDSVVRYGRTTQYEFEVRNDTATTLHHVEIPLEHRDAVYHYSVQSGENRSSDATFKTCPANVVRVAVVANWQSKPDLTAIVQDQVDILMTAGDNIANIWQRCGEDQKDCVIPYAELIDAYPGLFRSTPVLPALGNHDREIRPRGPKPPRVPVYDVDATAFCRFFELPDEEWKWHFDVPEVGIRFIALDFSHISDFGTTWQTCHAFDEGSPQFRWYEKLVTDSPPLVVTLYNERNASIRNRARRRWHDLFRHGTCCISGFGYYAERAELDDHTYYNTSLNGRGDQYPDPHSRFLAGIDTYMLLTATRDGPLVVEIKSLQGKVLDRREFARD